MKNLLIVLMVVISISLAGGICKSLSKLSGVRHEVTAYTEREQFPQGMATYTINPVTAVPIY